MKPTWLTYALLSALVVTLTAVGCESTSKAATYNANAIALEIVTAATFKADTAPSPVTPDEKVPRKDCKECNGTGTITHGDGHKTACQNCYAAAISSCPCGPTCTCDNCPADCLGELITLADLKTDKASSLPIATVALATSPQSGSCTNGSCGPSRSSSGLACGTSGSGSCGSGSCGSGDGAFMNRGPARRFVSRVRPVRRAAGFINRVRPVRRLAGCLFGRCG